MISLDIIKVITKLPNSEQSYKGKVKTHNYINRQNHMYIEIDLDIIMLYLPFQQFLLSEN